MKLLFGLFLSVISFISCVASASSIIIGEQFTLHSNILNEDRTILVSVPVGYDDANTNYPVLYLLDGELNIRHVVGSAELLTRTGHIPPIIIVGIKSVDRIRDMTISHVASQSEHSGGGDKLLKFISDELIPHIDSNYRTHPFRILEGHSFGGLLSGYSLIEKTALFNAHIIISPAFWWDGELIFRKAESFLAKAIALNRSIYFGIGTEDGYGMRQELKRFVELLEKHPSKNLRIAYREFEDEGHMSAPYLVNYHGLKHVFADIVYSKEKWPQFTSEDFLQHENKIANDYGKAIKQTGESYVNLAVYLTEQKNFAGAITVLKRNSEQYPNYDVNFARLAEAYQRNNQPNQAIKAYQKAYKLASASNKGTGGAGKYLNSIKFIKNPIANAVLDTYVGRYESPQRTFIISRSGPRLQGELLGMSEFSLYPETKQLFYLTVAPVKLEFVTGKNNTVEKLIMHSKGKKLDVYKVN